MLTIRNQGGDDQESLNSGLEKIMIAFQYHGQLHYKFHQTKPICSDQKPVQCGKVMVAHQLGSLSTLGSPIFTLGMIREVLGDLGSCLNHGFFRHLLHMPSFRLHTKKVN